MYAIVEIGGMQYRMEPGQKLLIPRLSKKEGAKLSFKKILLLSDDEIDVGTPVVENATVEAKILAHVRGAKIVVYKRKRRKGYQKRQGHRQDYTQIQVKKINRGAREQKDAAS